ncbi:MAG: T9SS type A sorting domain-containing protein [Bacteroidales bacterium]|jgi:hypothetical protein|nr:T9SS type A sorting domain-containing protein [Bacteroidales bacterium]
MKNFILLLAVIASFSFLHAQSCDPAKNLTVGYSSDCTKAILNWGVPGKCPIVTTVPKKIQGEKQPGQSNLERVSRFATSTAINNEPVVEMRGPTSEFYCSNYAASETSKILRKGILSTPTTTTNVGTIGNRAIQASEYINGTLYAIDYGAGTNRLGTINMETGAWTNIKNNVASDAVSLCYNPTNGLVYTFQWDPGSFGTIDLTTGNFTHVGNVTTTMSAAIDNDGVCYAITSDGYVSSPLWFGTVNLATGQFTKIGPDLTGSGSVQELSVDRETNELYWGRVDGFLYKINKTNAATTNLGIVSGTPMQLGMFSLKTSISLPTCEPISNLSITSTGNTVNLSWSAAPGSPTGYKIEYDGTTLTTVTTTSYTHNSVPNGLHTYTITALFSESCIPLGVTKTHIVGDYCMFRFVLRDAEGDGWGGSQIIIMKGGVLLEALTVGNDVLEVTKFVVLPTGTLNFFWEAEGSADFECSFDIYNSNDDLIYTCPNAELIGGEFFTYHNDCGGAPTPIAYNVYRDTEKLTPNPITTTFFEDITFDKTKAYTWSVKVACEGGGESAPVTKEMAACYDAICKPVTGVNAVFDEAAKEVAVTWTAPSGGLTVQKYKIFEGEDEIGEATTTTYKVDISGLTAGEYTRSYCVLPVFDESVCTGDVQKVCGDVSFTLSIKDYTNTFSIRPNPAINTISIKAKSDFNKIEVVNFLGQKVIAEQNDGNSAILDISTLTNGVYFVRIISENGASVMKFVKQQ